MPRDVTERIHAMCLALPEVTRRIDPSHVPNRSTAFSFDVRRRSFCLLVATRDRTGAAAPVLILRAACDEREALVAHGRPYFAPRAGVDRIGVRLTRDTDWDEIREMVTDSYRLLAPKKLSAQLDA